MKRTNLFLAITAGMTIVSGLILQLHYHLLGGERGATCVGFDANQWRVVHIVSAASVVALALHHAVAHKRWYKNSIKNRIPATHRPTIALTLISVVTVVTGFLPLSMVNDSARFVVVEFHDKVALLFLVFVVIHIAGRFKRLRCS